jgi:hypothetical protein
MWFSRVQVEVNANPRVHGLTQDGPQDHFMCESEEIMEALFGLKIFVKNKVANAFKHEGVIDRRGHTNAFLSIPTSFSTSTLGFVHDVVGHEGSCLKL